MSDTRCPRCGAVLPANAQWCTLCYLDLREQAAPAAPAAPAPEQAPLVQQPPLVRPPTAPQPVAPQPVAPPPAPFTAAPMPPQPVAQAPGAPLPVAQPPVAQPPAAPFAPSAVPVSPATAPAAPPPLPPPPAAQQPVAEHAVAQPEAVVAPLKEPTWPCFNCGVSVPMSEDHCPACGSGFLAHASEGHSLRVPGFGDVGRLASGQKLMLGVLVTLALIVFLVVVFTVGGKFL